ncbi:hypothetical protein [Actinomadura alba]|uniref:Uncharacterized protein n=1 Tax=Actinomadura alba TaxID=406431 RepID=A0ABR7LQ65_9ACTN|nr:hypothetical protein [Actinomadura alba]MBC6466985.1 hypothetical protein [Actinomadura alba]
MSKINYTRSLALAAASAALAGGVVSLSVSANAGLDPRGDTATPVATDVPDPATSAGSASGASSRKAGGDRADGRRVPTDDPDAEDMRAIGRDALAQKALEASGKPEPAPAAPQPPAPAAQPAPGGQAAKPGPAGQEAPSAAAPQGPSAAAQAPSAGPAAQQAPSARPASQQGPGDQPESSENPQAQPAAQGASKANQQNRRPKAAPNPGIQGRTRETAPRGAARRAKHAQSHRSQAAQRVQARRPGAARVSNTEKAWRGLLADSPNQSESAWNEPW